MEFKVAGRLRQAAVCVHKQHTGRVAGNGYVNLAWVGAKLGRDFNYCIAHSPWYAKVGNFINDFINTTNRYFFQENCMFYLQNKFRRLIFKRCGET